MKIKFAPRQSLNDLAKSIKWKISNSPSEILRTKHESIIDEELMDLNEKNSIHFIFYMAIVFLSIMIASGIIFLENTKFEPLLNFIYGVGIFLLFGFIVAINNLSFKTIRNYKKLLFILKYSKKLFNDNSTEPKKIENQIDDIIFQIERGENIKNHEIELFDTRTIVMLVDILNNIKTIPKFNQVYHADLVNKITGCSSSRFKEFLLYPYEKSPKQAQKRDLIKRLEMIKTEFNKIDFHHADKYIDDRIGDIELN